MLKEKTIGLEVLTCNFDILEKHCIEVYEYGEKISSLSTNLDAIKRCFANIEKRTVFENDNLHITSIGYALFNNLSETAVTVKIKICLKSKSASGVIYYQYVGEEYIRGINFEDLLRGMGIITPV